MDTDGPPGDATLQLALDLHQQGDYAAAFAIYRALLQSYPENPQVLGLLGNSGNSTGPHLHFEVRPGGESAIDPLPWLRSHGLDPT